MAHAAFLAPASHFSSLPELLPLANTPQKLASDGQAKLCYSWATEIRFPAAARLWTKTPLPEAARSGQGAQEAGQGGPNFSAKSGQAASEPWPVVAVAVMAAAAMAAATVLTPRL